MITDFRVSVRFVHDKRTVRMSGAMELTFKRKNITAIRFEFLDSSATLWGELASTRYNISAIDDAMNMYMWIGARFGVPKINGPVEIAVESLRHAFYMPSGGDLQTIKTTI